MVINKKKSAIMFLQNSRSNKIYKKYKNLNHYEIPIVNNYKYLGIFLDNNVNFKSNTEYLIKKMKKNNNILTSQKFYNN